MPASVTLRSPGSEDRAHTARMALAATPHTLRSSTELVTAAPDDSIVEVGTRMLDTGVRHVVLREGDDVVGIVSIRDVLRALIGATR